MLHTGGEGVHTSSDSTDGETRLHHRVRMEENSLDHIQNVCVSAQVEHIDKLPWTEMKSR